MAERFLSDDAMGYLDSRTPFVGGAPFLMDDSYRISQLPVVRPGHPQAIRYRRGRPYRDGQHDTAWSVVLPVSGAQVASSDPMKELEQQLRDSSFGGCIAWEFLARRQDRLHATVCAGLGHGAQPTLSAAALTELSSLGPIRFELRGLFTGMKNLGRLYLRVYPEDRGGRHALHAVQQIMGQPVTDLFLVGLYNLVDDLTAVQARELQALVTEWWDVSILQWTATELWLLGARDDLVLDADQPRPITLCH